MLEYVTLDVAVAGRMDRPPMATATRSTAENRHGRRGSALAVAIGVALGLSACGGGGSNVRPSTPPSGGGAPIQPATVYVGDSTLVVKSGESSKPVIMGSRSVLDNAGTVAGPNADIGVSASGGTQSVRVLNHDGGRIEGKNFALQLWSAAPTIENMGAGSIIRSDGVAIEFIDHGSNSKITNSGGATIRGGKTAIHLQRGGTVKNGAGSIIEATGTTTGDCVTVGSCSIYVNPDTTNSDLSRATYLENAGTIIGKIQLDPLARNEVTLWAGSTIIGDLSMGHGTLTLDGESGTMQRFSHALIGATDYPGGVTKRGEGTWILDTPLALAKDLHESYPSAQIFAGSLQIGSGGTEGPVALKAVYAYDGGRLVFDRSDDFVFDSNFRGGGTLSHVGSGLLTLSFNGSAGVPAVGLLEIGAGSRVLITAYTGGNARNDGELTFKSPGDTFYWAGDISGAGSVIQSGAGHLTLAGMNTYSGTTVVDSGSLELRQGLTGDVRINPAGAFFAGTVDLNNYVPRIGGTLYNAGRFVITQGDPVIWSSYAGVPGDFFIGGDYVQASTGTFSVTLGDKLDISGVARLEGGTLEVRGAVVGYVANTHTDVLTAAGGVTGTFDRLVKGPGVVFTSSTIHYNAHSVWLDTTGLDVTTAAMGNGIGYTPVSMSSAMRVQGAFRELNDRIGAGSLAGVAGDFLHSAGQFQRAPSVEAAQASLRSLSGQMHAASASMTFRVIDAGNRAISDHFDDLRDGGAAVGMWTKRIGSNGGMARSGFGAVGFQHDGWLVGNDYRMGHSGVAGFAFGQGLGRQQLEHAVDRDDSRRTESMLYAGMTRGKWYSQGRLGFGSYRQDVSRQLLLGVTAEDVWTRYGGRYGMAYGESGLHIGHGNARLAPFLSLEYARRDREAFAEHGAGGFGLRSDSQAVDRWQAGVGIRASHQWDFGNGRMLDFSAHAQWRRTVASSGEAMDASFVGLQQWSALSGIGMSRHGSVFGVGMDARLSRRSSLKFAYDYENGQYDSGQGLSALFNMAF